MPVTKSMLMSGCAILAYAASTVLSPAAGYARDDAEVGSAAQDAAGPSHKAPTESSRVARNGLSQDLTITRARLQEDGVQYAEVFRFNLSGLLSGYFGCAQAVPRSNVRPLPAAWRVPFCVSGEVWLDYNAKSGARGGELITCLIASPLESIINEVMALRGGLPIFGSARGV